MDRETTQAVIFLTALIEEMLEGERVRLLTGQWNDLSDTPELTPLGVEAQQAIETIHGYMGGN